MRKAPKPPKRSQSDSAAESNTKKPERPPHPGESESITERRSRAFGLRKAGASYRQIAQQLSVSLHTAWADVNAELLELREQTKADAEDVRELELQRCDEMILGLWPAVRRGDPKAVMAAVRVQDRRARLLGLDITKQQIELTGQLAVEADVTGDVQRELDRLAAALAAGGTAAAPLAE